MENIELSAQLHLKCFVNHVSWGTLLDTLGIRLILGNANAFSNIIIFLKRALHFMPVCLPIYLRFHITNTHPSTPYLSVWSSIPVWLWIFPYTGL